MHFMKYLVVCSLSFLLLGGGEILVAYGGNSAGL